VKVFTVSEANALLPRLNVMVSRQLALIKDLDVITTALTALGVDAKGLEPQEGDSAEVLDLKVRLKVPVNELRSRWREIEATGAVVKDVRQGLVDFPGRLEGQAVWLCWRYGETAVAHWHPMDQGFEARKPLPRTSIPPTLN
jgi:hypothetical protein